MENDFLLSSYDYHLPEENIAQHPASSRDLSRLLVMDGEKEELEHRHFSNITEYFRPGDILVVNNTKVFPARFLGHKETGGKVEILLLQYPEMLLANKTEDGWCTVEALALLKSSKRPKPGNRLIFGEHLEGIVQELFDNGQVQLKLSYNSTNGKSLDDLFTLYGQMPLPPYIKRPQGTTGEDFERYQTRYADQTGSVAAPTAGLHFSDTLLDELRDKGVEIVNVTLHVGYGTFAPVRTEDIRSHKIHAEYIQITPETALTLNEYKKYGSRIWAVGTTTARTLEFATDEQGSIKPYQGLCDLYIYPGYQFRVVDNLITNFHLPRSSLLFLVSALAGRQRTLNCYKEAVIRGYRFYSYGDAIAIITRK
jgi:S-adenosylmethionine:tRNA ribosyltransferase-isomerase